MSLFRRRSKIRLGTSTAPMEMDIAYVLQVTSSSNQGRKGVRLSGVRIHTGPFFVLLLCPRQEIIR